MTGIRKGEPWGEPSAGPADVAVDGDDAALAAAVSAHPPGVRLAWHPTPAADFARAVGVTGRSDGATRDLPCDAMVVVAGVPSGEGSGPDGDRPQLAVNMAIFGFRPDQVRWSSPSHHLRVVVDGRVVHDGPTTGVVVANGQFLAGADLVPRGHPGDGRLEVQVYAVPRRQRREMRERLAVGTHVPHPGIRQTTGRIVDVALAGTGPRAPEREQLAIDGTAPVWAARLHVEVRERAFALVV